MPASGPDGEDSPSGPILCGIETEYGFTVEGHGAEDQIDDAIAFVKGYPGARFEGWDYDYESPRADLRGFSLERLAIDPEDAKRDAGRVWGDPHEVRSDRILPNGARFYNDHGHPEYATPECWSLSELVLHDKAGELVLLDAARAMEDATGKRVVVYKNNTDFHGSSYGTHESYLCPRELGFERLFPAVLPILIARPILTGAGKVGSESGSKVTYQLSSRADFFVEAANAETLFRRPIFNTRDEPHADPRRWIRLHVISGDANMIPGCTRRKVGLVKLAIMLAKAGESPVWEFQSPVRAIQSISRDLTLEAKVELKGQNWTTAYEILESYLAAAENVLELNDEMCALVGECRVLMDDLRGPRTLACRKIDWAAKQHMIDAFLGDSGGKWTDAGLQAYDLEYHNIDGANGLYFALEAMDEVEPYPSIGDRVDRLTEVPEKTRAWARGLAVKRFGDQIVRASWNSLVFRREQDEREVTLPPNLVYTAKLGHAPDVGKFIEMIEEQTHA